MDSPIIKEDKMSVYTDCTTTIIVSRKVVIEGWYASEKKMWQSPLVKNVSNVEHQLVAVPKLRM